MRRLITAFLFSLFLSPVVYAQQLGLGGIFKSLPASKAPDYENMSINVPEGKIPDAEKTDQTYWKEREDGWFWYKDPPPEPKPEQKLDAKSRRIDDRPPEVRELESMQKKYDTLLKVAVMNPTPENLKAYWVYQRVLTDKAFFVW